MGSSMFQAGDAERRQPPLLSIWSSLAVLSLTFVMPATVLNSKHYLVRQQRREASRGLASRGLPWVSLALLPPGALWLRLVLAGSAAPSGAPGTAQVCARKQEGGHYWPPSGLGSPEEGRKLPRLARVKCDPDEPVPKSLPRGPRCPALHHAATNLFPPPPTPSPEPQPRGSPAGHTAASPRDLKKTPISAGGPITEPRPPTVLDTCPPPTRTPGGPAAPTAPHSAWLCWRDTPHCTRQRSVLLTVFPDSVDGPPLPSGCKCQTPKGCSWQLLPAPPLPDTRAPSFSKLPCSQ